MRGKPLIPFGIIAVLGILLMVSMSLFGQGQRAELLAEESGEVEEVEEFDDPVEAGEGFVQQSCIGCHGGNLDDGSAPALTSLDGKYDVDEIADIVMNGIGEMPPMPHNDVEADAIAQYLLSISE